MTQLDLFASNPVARDRISQLEKAAAGAPDRMEQSLKLAVIVHDCGKDLAAKVGLVIPPGADYQRVKGIVLYAAESLGLVMQQASVKENEWGEEVFCSDSSPNASPVVVLTSKGEKLLRQKVPEYRARSSLQEREEILRHLVFNYRQI